jgi:predicted metal-dependent peptidase
MRFHRVIGKIDPKLVEKAESALSKVFLELGLRPDNGHVGTAIGGDPLIFSLLYPMQHVCTRNIPTAGTDGKRYYWNPKFVLGKSRLGLRIVCAHEAWHAIYMHPQRRGKRHPRLWNIAVDYIVNGTIMDDLRHRKLDPASTFTKELGNFCTLPQLLEYYKDPRKDIVGSEHWAPDPPEEEVELPHPDDNRELTEKEKKEIEKKEAKIRYFYADPDLPDDMKRPEKIYDLLYQKVPKCPKCGRIGVYVPPKTPGDQNDIEPNEENEQHKHEDVQTHNHPEGDQCCNCPDSHSNDAQHDGENTDGSSGNGGNQPQNGGSQPGGNQPGSCCEGPCPVCGGGYNIFGNGDTLDDHMDAGETQEKMAKRIADAIEASKRMAGSIPAELEEELGKLLAPKIRWQDFLRAKIARVRDGNTKNDWTRFRTRPLFGGLFIPKRINEVCDFGCLLDTSGSMSQEDMTFGVSQLQAIDERSEGWVVPADATIYWKDATKLRRANAAEISRIRVVGRGGTKYAEFFRDYEQIMGHCDFLIVITDGFLLDQDIAEMVNPGIDVIWLITSGSAFNAPFGRVFDLKS